MESGCGPSPAPKDTALHAQAPAPPQGPQARLITPVSGSGLKQLFSALYSHPAGSTHITNVRVLFNPYVDGRNACYVYYDRKTSSLLLVKDSGQGTTRARLGAPGSLTNSQCTVDPGASSAMDKGNDLTLRLQVTLKSGFAGNKNTYLYAEDIDGKSTGLQQRGSWTVP